MKIQCFGALCAERTDRQTDRQTHRVTPWAPWRSQKSNEKAGVPTSLTITWNSFSTWPSDKESRNILISRIDKHYLLISGKTFSLLIISSLRKPPNIWYIFLIYAFIYSSRTLKSAQTLNTSVILQELKMLKLKNIKYKKVTLILLIDDI